MGTKILRWFFQLMGNRSSCAMQCPFARFHEEEEEETAGMKGPTTSTTTIKLIRSDGVVKIYDQPIKVCELMLEFPKHMVCSSDSFYIGQKIQTLSEDDQLQPGQSYFLLPNHLFQSVLSFVTITSFISSSSQCQSDDHLKKALLSCQPFHIQKTPSGYLRVNVTEEFISQLMILEEERKKETRGRVCTTPQLQKDYAQLVVGPRQWKPKLETITEILRENRKSDSQSLQKNLESRKSSGVVQYCSSSPSVSSSNPKLSSSEKRIKGFLGKSRKREQRNTL